MVKLTEMLLLLILVLSVFGIFSAGVTGLSRVTIGVVYDELRVPNFDRIESTQIMLLAQRCDRIRGLQILTNFKVH